MSMRAGLASSDRVAKNANGFFCFIVTGERVGEREAVMLVGRREFDGATDGGLRFGQPSQAAEKMSEPRMNMGISRAGADSGGKN